MARKRRASESGIIPAVGGSTVGIGKLRISPDRATRSGGIRAEYLITIHTKNGDGQV
jgi:hypothetical protein